MDRFSIERLLRQYLGAVELANRPLIDGNLWHEYAPHYSTAREILARWQGGDSGERLRGAIAVELVGYRANPPPGRHAEMVGAAFGAVCRAVGVM